VISKWVAHHARKLCINKEGIKMHHVDGHIVGCVLRLESTRLWTFE